MIDLPGRKLCDNFKDVVYQDFKNGMPIIRIAIKFATYPEKIRNIVKEFEPAATFKYKRKFIDESGKQYGKLKVLHPVEENYTTSFLCQCECGNQKVFTGYQLRYGQTISCGCYRRKIFEKARLKRESKKTGLGVLQPSEESKNTTSN